MPTRSIRLSIACLAAVTISSTVHAQSPFDVLTAFGRSGPQNPQAALLRATDGNYYGTSSSGGEANAGTVFRLTPAGSLTQLSSFSGGADGGYPTAGLVQGGDGSFYGTASSGGASSAGTIFQITASGALTVLHSFTGGADGAYPYAGLVQAADGNMYGTTSQGGAFGAGTIFQITSGGTFIVLYTFTGGADGGFPYAGLIQGADGRFYGTASSGGASGAGTVFQLTSSGGFTALYSFTGATDGAYPVAGV